MHDADSAGPVLPVELERLIFELAAWQDPEIIFTLILVAKRVCIWIEPELYHTVVFRKSRSLLMLQSKPAEFLRQHVHHVAISVELEYDDVVQILSTCTGVHDLAIWNNAATRPDLLPLIHKLTNLQRLSANLFALFGGREGFTLDQFRIPPPEELPLASLTHLDLFGPLPERLWSVFRTLRQLTHLALTDLYPRELIPAALGTCPVLRLLVVKWSLDAKMPAASKISTDPRFCIVRCTDYEFDWERGARGRTNVWHAAATKIRARRKGLRLRLLSFSIDTT
ncbi:hypothetical protein B0H16DRAFT_1885585 [Mycena metata]|uniref:F-box domain-containing protein n=1 Tax=Mycena metata TaxID=1033252 RepID=A0AAD7J5F7_9AGAR|nr:hypothetical protein B0H16DRAFT_1885585 [Mycena metata]